MEFVGTALTGGVNDSDAMNELPKDAVWRSVLVIFMVLFYSSANCLND